MIGSRQRLAVSYNHISNQLTDHPDAYQSLEAYGLTSPEAILPHFVADEETLRKAVNTATVNSLEHPHYEFYYPWDYAAEKQNGFLTVHQFIIDLKQAAYPAFLADLEKEIPDSKKLKTTFSAETLYLIGFGNYLEGMTLTALYRMFDYVLSIAPWNDSLRARIYSLYTYTASIRRDPAEKAQLMKRARSLYETTDANRF